MIRSIALVALATLAGCQAHRHGSIAPGHVFQHCSDCPEMIVVPAGAFSMGSNAGTEERPEGPIHRVRIERPFALGRFEVTFAQFEAFVRATGHQTQTGCRVWLEADAPPPDFDPSIPGNRMYGVNEDGVWRGFVNSKEHDWRRPGWRQAPQPSDPVACVSWGDAKAYADWLAEMTGQPYRLPTEAEWEYAARDGTTTTWPWGERPEDGCRYANIYDRVAGEEFVFPWSAEDCSDGWAAVAPVGSFPPNGFGLYDMIGNVWEWNEDCYVAPYPDDVPTDGSAVRRDPCDRYSVRGGSWITHIQRQRPAFRGRDPEPTLYSFFGIRVALDLEPAELR